MICPFTSSFAVGLATPIPIFPAGAATVPFIPLPKIRLPIFNWFEAVATGKLVFAQSAILLSQAVRFCHAKYPIAELLDQDILEYNE